MTNHSKQFYYLLGWLCLVLPFCAVASPITGEVGLLSQLQAGLAHPQVALFLCLLGLFGLFLEGLTPGALVFGLCGAISLGLAIYGFILIPANLWALTLLFVGLALFFVEAFSRLYTIPGIAGSLCFVLGSYTLANASAVQQQASLVVLLGFAIGFALLMLLTATQYKKLKKHRIRTGADGMLGEVGSSQYAFTGRGHVIMHGEVWQAHCTQPLAAQQSVKVIRCENLILEVQPLETEPSNTPAKE